MRVRCYYDGQVKNTGRSLEEIERDIQKRWKNVIKQMHGKTQTRINNHQSRGRWYFCGEF